MFVQKNMILCKIFQNALVALPIFCYIIDCTYYVEVSDGRN